MSNCEAVRKSMIVLIGLLVVLCLVRPPSAISQESWLSRYDLSDKQPLQFRLPAKLGEASGLATTTDGRLLTHNDEHGTVYDIDYSNGAIRKQFTFGSSLLRADFEDIACVENMVYMVTSDGDIYAFREGQNGERKQFQTYKTFLSRKNDVEGLAYDPVTDCLLLACKGSAGSGLEQYKAVYSFSLKGKKLLDKPRFLLPLKAFAKTARRGQFNPSGIARHPISGTFFIISSDGELIVEISKDGNLLSHQKIPKKVNSHPEGIAFTKDLTMILCNDGQGKASTITLYPPKVMQ